MSDLILTELARGPRTRPALECAMVAAGYAPAGVVRALWALKREGKVVHLRRARRGVQSLWGIV